jgi:hypothetical protein
MTREHNNQGAHARRGFLKRSVSVSSGIAAAGFVGAFGIRAADAPEDDIATLLHLATTAEALAVIFYYTAITTATFRIDEEDAEHLRLVMDAEMHHLQILQSFGGASLTQQFYMPERMLSDASRFVDTSLRIERVFAGAYLAATHQFAALGHPKLAATAAQHSASEAQHLMLISHVAGLRPSDVTLPAPLFYQVSDALPALAPFLRGGAGFGAPVRFPSPDQYHTALAGITAERGRPFVQAYGADTRAPAAKRVHGAGSA